MIVYLDTSALVKLFVEEAHSDIVRQAVSGARAVTTHAIAYVEACTAFARAAHARTDDALFAALRMNLDIQWETWEVLSVTEPLIRRAADLAGRYRLRGYDSLHLAAARIGVRGFPRSCAVSFWGVRWATERRGEADWNSVARSVALRQ